ncbi:MAG: ComF family protein [Aaplasma endosymbiont of Hyalomma asiaticum]
MEDRGSFRAQVRRLHVLGHILGLALGKIVDIFFPRLCLNCGNATLCCEPICNSCFHALKFLHGRYCVLCGGTTANRQNTCMSCNPLETYLNSLDSIFEYDNASRNMILNLKFHDDLTNVHIYAKWLYAKGATVLSSADLIIPMPLHRTRLFSRKFNQAALLARELSKICGVPCDVFVLKKNRNTRPQSGLPAHERVKNVASTFTVTNVDMIVGKFIVLIDDVVTTGASLQACAKALKQAGAREVYALTLGRTMHK